MTEPDHATQALLEVLYERFNSRDVDAILPSLAPDVEWPNGWRLSGNPTAVFGLAGSGD